MAAAPPQVANFIKDVAALKKRVREIELALRKTAATLKIKLSSLTDVKIAGAVNHQVLTYMAPDWVPRGGPPVEGSNGRTFTGAEDIDLWPMVGGEWVTSQAAHGSARVHLDITHTGDYPHDIFTLLVGVFQDGTATEIGHTPATSIAGVGGFATDNLTVPVDLAAGTPHLYVSVKQPSGAPDVDVTATWLVSPLP
jgi:hypothetical protein